MNPNNNKRGSLRSNMLSKASQLAKIFALDQFKIAIKQLKLVGFELKEVILLIQELWEKE